MNSKRSSMPDMHPEQIKAWIEKGKTAAVSAGRAIMEVYQIPEYAQAEPALLPTTKADKRSHQLIAEALAATNLPVLSEEGSEIPYTTRNHWNYFWMADPLDGTKEFIQKNGEFTVNVALMKGGKPVAGVVYIPVSEILYYGSTTGGAYKTENGIVSEFVPVKNRLNYHQLIQKEHISVVVSRSHLSVPTQEFLATLNKPRVYMLGSALKFIALLENKADLYIRFGRTMEWDTAAAHALLNATNRGVYTTDLGAELSYNKPDLANPDFIAF